MDKNELHDLFDKLNGEQIAWLVIKFVFEKGDREEFIERIRGIESDWLKDKVLEMFNDCF